MATEVYFKRPYYLFEDDASVSVISESVYGKVGCTR